MDEVCKKVSEILLELLPLERDLDRLADIKMIGSGQEIISKRIKIYRECQYVINRINIHFSNLQHFAHEELTEVKK